MQVRYSVSAAGRAKSLAPSVEKLEPDYAAEKEAVYTGRTKFQITDVARTATPQGIIYDVKLEELP